MRALELIGAIVISGLIAIGFRYLINNLEFKREEHVSKKRNSGNIRSNRVSRGDDGRSR